MNWRSHAIIGAIVAMAICYLLGTRELVELAVFAIFGALSALVPDLDHDMSKGRKLLDIVVIVSSFFVIYWSNCRGTVCNPDFSVFITWLVVLGIYFLLFRFFKPKHRGITHTLVISFVFGLVIFVLFDWKMALVGIVGYISHLLADNEIKLI